MAAARVSFGDGRSGKRAQTATEYIIILSIFISFTLILGVMNWEVLINHDSQILVVKAKDVVNEVYKASELVYKEGKDARMKIFVNVPGNIIGASTADGIIEMNMSIQGNEVSIYRKAYFDILGGLPTDSGYYWMNVTSYGSYVQIDYR